MPETGRWGARPDDPEQKLDKENQQPQSGRIRDISRAIQILRQMQRAWHRRGGRYGDDQDDGERPI